MYQAKSKSLDSGISLHPMLLKIYYGVRSDASALLWEFGLKIDLYDSDLCRFGALYKKTGLILFSESFNIFFKKKQTNKHFHAIFGQNWTNENFLGKSTSISS